MTDTTGRIGHEIRDALAATPGRLVSAITTIAAVTDPMAARPDGEWGPPEITRHLIAVEDEVHQARLRDLADRPEPHWSWTEPGPWPGLPAAGLDELLALFAARRAQTLTTIDALDADGWARSGSHDTFGHLDVAGLLREALAHDEIHLAALIAPVQEPR